VNIRPAIKLNPVHAIRLRGPWQCQPLAWTSLDSLGRPRSLDRPLPPGGRTRVPSDWSGVLGADFRGRAVYRRSFHQPTGLDDRHTVWLVIECVDAWGEARLNGQRLGRLSITEGPARFDVTELLRDRNRLEVEVELPASREGAPLHRPGRTADQAGGLIGPVRLEITLPSS
jgi:hypothetical protein